jgi:hypothetical protein
MTPSEIITDEEIERVHANANFGDRSKRAVVNESLLKCACGYHIGSTARRIVAGHGLTKDPCHTITQRGRQYLWAVYGKRPKAISVLEDLAGRHTSSEHCGELDYFIGDARETLEALRETGET